MRADEALQKKIARQRLHELLVRENQRTADIAQRLDSYNPELRGAFTGTPSERIERQIDALIFGEGR